MLKIAADGGQIVSSRTPRRRRSACRWSPTTAPRAGSRPTATTLALIKPRDGLPARDDRRSGSSTPTRCEPRETIHLDGDFSFDAISPDGRRLYLVHYPTRATRLDYEVRAYDVARGKLLADPIVDPDEPEEQMAGFPLARQTSPDGRWAYTLYAGGEETFIHALDTRGLDGAVHRPRGRQPRDIYRLGLNLDPASGELTVLEQGTPVAVVDPQTFEVSEPAPVASPDTTEPPTPAGRAGSAGRRSAAGWCWSARWRRCSGGAAARRGRRRGGARAPGPGRRRSEREREPVR